MISHRDRGDLARFYTVTDPRRHQKGFTIYKVTARVVSRKNPEDVQEIVTWKRYSDFKKLHRDLWQLHKLLFRQTELFPPFAKAKLFGRFDEAVIEERRQCAEDLLQFSANIPALYSSSQFEDFFKGGEVHDGSDLIGPAEPFTDFTDSLSDCSSDVRKDSFGLDDVTFASQSECGGLSGDSDLISLTVDVDSLSGLDNGMASNQTSPSRPLAVSPCAESVAQGFSAASLDASRGETEKESRGLFPVLLRQKTDKSDYLTKAGELITMALNKETEQDYEAAFSFYRKGVDLLLEGVQGESSPTRREAVKKKTAEYLMRAETISSLCIRRSTDEGLLSDPPGARSSRPSWNLRSPAEELKAFRVLGVIDKVLLVLDTRTQETFILKGLRKSSECSGSRKTIAPRCVPNMVCLHKYIISEESVFLVLEHAEGGKLWSHISKYLSRSTDGSFDVPEAKSCRSDEDLLKNLAPCPRNSVDSRSSDRNLLSVQQLHGSLTLSSQDDSSTQEEEGRESPLKWVDSASSSEEECTTSYLTLCNEYGQEKIEPDALSGELLLRLEQGHSRKGIDELEKPVSIVYDDSLLAGQEFKLSNETSEHGLTEPASMTDALSKSKNSPMELFRIDSKESASDFTGADFVEKAYNVDSEMFEPAPPFQDDDTDCEIKISDADKPSVGAHDTISRGSNDSVPVISFKDAALDDMSAAEEGRPDLLVNLPGSDHLESEIVAKSSLLESDDMEATLVETPDVLQIKSSLDQQEEKSAELREVTFENTKDPSSVGFDIAHLENNLSTLEQPPSIDPPSLTSSTSSSTKETSQCRDEHLSASKELGIAQDALPSAHSDPSEDLSANLTRLRIQVEDTDQSSHENPEKDIHKIFQELDAKLSEASNFFLPEPCIQRWAAQLVVALDSLHREGIVCRDLNPNNILLNDRGHIRLTYFSRWTEVEESCDSDAMERMFCAPEVGGIAEETETCDWWSLGAILFELFTGKALVECHPAGISTHTSVSMPENVSKEARSLVQQLLQFNPMERLGSGAAGAEDIRSHPFFTGVDWEEFTR
ncbi:ribosomal protein S6 kinase delta-1 [Spea bombifrons]|uniref:ribosomal protein S6 kinase delta-1 n=1 Tax=Spea bombifrons TaxID=233779 RepID=UPI00234B6B69|nr:ribosomal protein S6 kinase delta-1 [Spea bombifrons]